MESYIFKAHNQSDFVYRLSIGIVLQCHLFYSFNYAFFAKFDRKIILYK